MKFTKTHKNFLLKNIPGKSGKEAIELFYKEFGIILSISQLGNFKTRNNIISGTNGGQFQKGQTPFNKGKKWDEYMSKEGQANSRRTIYKKGNSYSVLNQKPIGSERKDPEGYTYVKTENSRRWKLKHRVIWEGMYGNIPTNHTVVFADGDKLNFEPSNLVLVNRSELLIMNRRKLFYNDKELTKAGLSIAIVIDKTNKLKRDKK